MNRRLTGLFTPRRLLAGPSHPSGVTRFTSAHPGEYDTCGRTSLAVPLNVLRDRFEIDGEGELQREHVAPPMLQKRGDRYYVTNDGHHRSMAAKAIGLEELYAGVETVPAGLLE